MSRSPSVNTSLRKMISALLLLGLLAILLSLYFLKYVPAQRSDFHRRAFLELSQIERSIQERNTAYISAISNSIDKIGADALGASPLTNYFRWSPGTDSVQPHQARPKNDKNHLAFQKIVFNQNKIVKDWQISYLLTGGYYQESLAVKVDSFIQPIVSTYKDIFADYILIVDTGSNSVTDNSGAQNNEGHKGNVIFNSGYLSVDYQVDMDTLLKKTDGFSVLNVHDVKIEGNSYKLFLYPIQLYNQHVILAGLISLDRYREGSESVPFDLITVGSILALLLLLNLPLLKIYIIGPIERITSLDIRMIITSYFLAAFMIFFLFFLFFLSRNQTISNKSTLTKLGKNIQHDFYSEINDICRQLGKYDTLYAGLHTDSTAGLHINNTNPLLLPLESLDSGGKDLLYADTLDKLFHPSIYPKMDLVFWIDGQGKWVARWAFKKQYQKTRRISVGDRSYFKDIKNDDLLSLPYPYDTSYAFTIQPTLSRLNGSYNVNVLIKSRYASDGRKPIMLGITAEMHSVCNTIMPPGYSFSIINNKGEILYDSKPGRCLLSNIFVEAGDNTDIEQCVHYRYNRFFKEFTLKGREVAMYSNPLPNLPYTLLVYYNLSVNDEFQFHSLGLACFCMFCLLALIALTSFFNEWGKKVPTLLSISPVNFDWLHPVPEKMEYYKHLARWMGKLLAVYAGAWLAVELFFPHQEPSLLIISLAFPFFVANHYYVIRQKYYDLQGKNSIPPGHSASAPVVSASPIKDLSASPAKDPSYPSGKKERSAREIARSFISLLRMPSFLPLGLILLVILVYIFASQFKWGERMIILSVFILFGITILRSSRKLSPCHYRLPGNSFPPILLRRYVLAILTGVLLITLVPATGLFALFYKEESNSELKMLKLNMARAIQSRRCIIDKTISDYSFHPADDSFLHASRYKNGIYFLDSLPIEPFRTDTTIAYHTFSGYTSLHRLLFSIDSTTLEPPGKKQEAGDSSWYFCLNSRKDTLMLFYKNQGARSDPGDMYFPIDPVTQSTAIGLLLDGIGSLGILSAFLIILGFLAAGLMAYLLTASLAKHIFLLDVLAKYQRHPFSNPFPLHVLKTCSNLQEPAPFFLSRECVKTIRDYEYRIIKGDITREADILRAQHALEMMYDAVWKAIPTDEKYILYDFALDGFTNYKAGILLYKLLQKGILLIDEDFRLVIMSHNFHNYLLSKDIFNKHLLNKDDIEVYDYMKNAKKKGSWQAFRVPLLIILAAAGLFIFLTQDALYQKAIGLFASVPSLAQMVISIFERSNGKDTDNNGASADPSS